MSAKTSVHLKIARVGKLADTNLSYFRPLSLSPLLISFAIFFSTVTIISFVFRVFFFEAAFISMNIFKFKFKLNYDSKKPSHMYIMFHHNYSKQRENEKNGIIDLVIWPWLQVVTNAHTFFYLNGSRKSGSSFQICQTIWISMQTIFGNYIWRLYYIRGGGVLHRLLFIFITSFFLSLSWVGSFMKSFY